MLFCGRKNGERAGVRCTIVAGLVGIGLNQVSEIGFAINAIAFPYSGFHIMGGDRNLRRSYSVFVFSDHEGLSCFGWKWTFEPGAHRSRESVGQEPCAPDYSLKS